MVRADWRAQYRAPSVAVCGSGGAEGEERAELECRGVGRYGAQDCAVDSEYEEQDLDPHAVESCGLA